MAARSKRVDPVTEVERRYRAAEARGGFQVLELADLPASAWDEFAEREFGMHPAKRERLVREWTEAGRHARSAEGLAKMLEEKGKPELAQGQRERAARLRGAAAELALRIGLSVSQPSPEETHDELMALTG